MSWLQYPMVGTHHQAEEINKILQYIYIYDIYLYIYVYLFIYYKHILNNMQNNIFEVSLMTFPSYSHKDNYCPEFGFHHKMLVFIPRDSAVKICLLMQEMWVRSLGQKDPLEKEMATHSCILAWETPRTEKPGGL